MSLSKTPSIKVFPRYETQCSGYSVQFTRHSLERAKLFPRKTCSSYLLKWFKEEIGSHTLVTEEKAPEKEC